jgi:hypothetical protein
MGLTKDCEIFESLVAWNLLDCDSGEFREAFRTQVRSRFLGDYERRFQMDRGGKRGRRDKGNVALNKRYSRSSAGESNAE